jgi:hypothetical protein
MSENVLVEKSPPMVLFPGGEGLETEGDTD